VNARRIAAAATVVAVTLGLTGCSGDDGDATPESSAPATTAAPIPTLPSTIDLSELPEEVAANLPAAALSLPGIDAACIAFAEAEASAGQADLATTSGQRAYAVSRAARVRSLADAVAATGEVEQTAADGLRAAAQAYDDIVADPTLSGIAVATSLIRAETTTLTAIVALVQAGARSCSPPAVAQVSIPAPTG
jgi:hypothetical protein